MMIRMDSHFNLSEYYGSIRSFELGLIHYKVFVDEDDGGKKKAKRKRSKEEIDVKNEYVITLYFTISKKN